MSLWLSAKRRRARRAVILLLPVVGVFILMVGAAVSPAGLRAAAASRESCLGPVAGQYVYDCANLLTPAEIADVETQATAVARAGAPTVVYLQVRDATAQQTLQDAIDLMNRWNVESRPGAHDGFVMFFNLQPGNLRHGQLALYAGAQHYQHGHLPQAELDRIRVDVMTPLLQDGQTAAGIAAGLQMVAHDLRYGPPPPPASQRVAASLGRLPLTGLALVFAGLVTWFVVRLRRLPPLSSARDEVGGREDPRELAGGELSPAMAGALINGRVNDALIEATILDFGRRGLLVLEPTGANTVRVRLQGSAAGLTDYEQTTWRDLVELAGGERGTISSEQLTHLRDGWSTVKTVLRRELIERGWYDPTGATARRQPLYLLGVLGMAGAAAAVVLLLLSREGWAAIGLLIFLAASVAAFVSGHAVRDTTVEGEIAAAPWRGYVASVTAHDYQPNLDTDLPYFVALGLLGRLAPRLKAASERGYSPSWFRAHEEREHDTHTVAAGGFYPYWLAFHSSATPAPRGGASGGYAGGGAAGGGGGSAGGF